MDNFINRQGNSFKAYWILHGTPRGVKNNASIGDPDIFVDYADFHKGSDSHIEFPSKPGEKFIKEQIYEGCFAYTVVHTGIHEITSDRAGSNYGAITIITEDINGQNLKNFERDLKKWFKENILDKFTYQEVESWIKWNTNATELFDGKYDKDLNLSITSLIKPYLEKSAQKSNNQHDKTKEFNEAKQQLQNDIKELEEQLRQKREELQKLNNSQNHI